MRTARIARPVPVAASSELELDADDILESADIEVGTPEVAADDVLIAEAAQAEPALDEPAPTQASGAIDPDATNVLPRGAASAAAAAATLLGMEPPAALAVPAAPAPTPAALAALFVPPPPHTSPLPLESVIVDEPAEPAGEPVADRTQELRRDALSQVAAAAERLESAAPGQTEVLVRSAMPAALQAPQANTAAFAATAPAWSQVRPAGSEHLRAAQPASPRPSSIAPVAVDALPPHMMMRQAGAAAPPSNKRGLLIGGLAFAAVALIGLVGVGGYVASRTLSAKADAVALSTPVESAPAVESGAGAGSYTQGASAPAAAASTVSEPTPTPSAPGIDIASLPSAPAPIAASPAATAAQHSAVSSNGGSSTGGTAGARSASSQASGRTSGASSLPAPGGAAPLPPPASAPAAPAAAAGGTGVVRVDSSLRAVVVDGSYRRANDGVVTVSCGRHRIKAGMKEAQSVDVPCGGAVTL